MNEPCITNDFGIPGMHFAKRNFAVKLQCDEELFPGPSFSLWHGSLPSLGIDVILNLMAEHHADPGATVAATALQALRSRPWRVLDFSKNPYGRLRRRTHPRSGFAPSLRPRLIGHRDVRFDSVAKIAAKMGKG